MPKDDEMDIDISKMDPLTKERLLRQTEASVNAQMLSEEEIDGILSAPIKFVPLITDLIYICEECPCLNRDMEEGATCNMDKTLRIDSAYIFLDGKERFSHYARGRCNLEVVVGKDKGKDFRPVQGRLMEQN